MEALAYVLTLAKPLLQALAQHHMEIQTTPVGLLVLAFVCLIYVFRIVPYLLGIVMNDILRLIRFLSEGIPGALVFGTLSGFCMGYVYQAYSATTCPVCHVIQCNCTATPACMFF